MGQLGKLDTDTQALTARINAHAAYGARNLEDWIFSQLDVRPGQHVLDLGCGTGKQALPLARLVGPAGHVTAVDIAAESLAFLRDQAISAGLLDRLSLVESELDKTENYLPGTEEFDRAVASYSIYYARDHEHVFRRLHAALKPGGSFFFCGPAKSNNAELKAFHSTLAGRALPPGAAPFMEETGQELAQRLFDHVETTYFENPLSFTSAAALQAYWRSYNLYDPQLDSAFQTAAHEHFNKHAAFTTHKRVLGVLATK